MFVSVAMRHSPGSPSRGPLRDSSARHNKRPRSRPNFNRATPGSASTAAGLAPRSEPRNARPVSLLAELATLLDQGLHEQFLSSVHRHAASLGTRGINAVMDATAKAPRLAEGQARLMSEEIFLLLDPPDYASYSILIAMHGRHGNPKAAKAVFVTIVDPNEICISALLSVYSKSGLVDDAWEIFRTTPKARLRSPPVYNAMLGVLVRHGYLEPAFEIFDQKYSTGDRQSQSLPDSYTISTILGACVKSKDLERAVQVVRRAEELEVALNSVVYNSLLDVCTKSPTPGRVGEFIRGSGGVERVQPTRSRDSVTQAAAKTCDGDIRQYNSLIHGYGRAGMPGKAMEVFQELCANGFSPDAITFNSLLGAAAQKADFQMATKILDLMTRSYGFAPDQFTYHTLLFSCSKRGKDIIAFDLYKRMRQSGVRPTAMTFTALLEVCGKRKQLLRAWDVLGLMRSEEVTPDSHIMNAMIHVCSRCGDVEGAFAVFRDMEQNGVKPDQITYNTLIHSVGRLGHTAKAWELLREMETRGIERGAAAYNSLATSYAYHGDVQSILDLFDLFKDNLTLNLPDRYSYGSLLEASIRARDLDSALGFRSDMNRLGFSVGAGLECWLVERLLQGGQASQALDLVDSMDERMVRAAFAGARKRVWVLVRAAQTRRHRQQIESALSSEP